MGAQLYNEAIRAARWGFKNGLIGIASKPRRPVSPEHKAKLLANLAKAHQAKSRLHKA
jgi:hypothetical protein